ncbi:hypothetical protein DFH08DRAFT_883994 [Mycena albidolilacea]|uniref:MYND-type domain-containing protein n=1 Tax=Mycena albidolilacea TaxID=1033008 RepID=A0AAD7EK29_9AGAR|nr:hypothetical protein DFH08DRAFT_883994 [Mycena albidolilacea]
MYAEVLWRLSDAIQNLHMIEMLEVLAPKLRNSDIAESWTDFIMLVTDRAEILRQVAPKKMCDNLACSKKDVKDAFQMCSKCKHSCYCSKECQNADWHAGSHKTACQCIATASILSLNAVT